MNKIIEEYFILQYSFYTEKKKLHNPFLVPFP